jgi:rhamnulose-1-phosphate aldolase
MKKPPNSLLRADRDDVTAASAEVARRGWAEANAGNLSLRLGAGLLVKRAGARMRDVAQDARAHLCLVRLGDKGPTYSVEPSGAVPTSELAAHVAVHKILVRHRRSDRAVLHTHPTALVALSLLVPGPRELVALLARMHSEGPLLIHGRVSAIPFYPPGSDELARATARALRDASAVIWPSHGMIASGPTLADALDIIEVADKAARIALYLGERHMRTAGLSFAQEMAVREAAGKG